MAAAEIRSQSTHSVRTVWDEPLGVGVRTGVWVAVIPSLRKTSLPARGRCYSAQSLPHSARCDGQRFGCPSDDRQQHSASESSANDSATVSPQFSERRTSSCGVLRPPPIAPHEPPQPEISPSTLPPHPGRARGSEFVQQDERLRCGAAPQKTGGLPRCECASPAPTIARDNQTA